MAPTALAMGERWNNRALFALLWPLIIDQILAVTMGAADTIMVNKLGEYAVSGVNIIDNINNLFIIGITALCTGGAVVVSQYIGRGEPGKSRDASKQLLYITTLLSLFIMLVAIILRRPMITLFYGKIEQDVFDSAVVYFLITALSYPFLAVYNANAALFRAAGNSKVPMWIAMLANVINIGGNAFLIYTMNLGVAGAALSTLLCRITAAIITTVLLNRKTDSPVSLSQMTKVRLQMPLIRSILNIAVPSGLETSMFQIGRLLTQRIFPVFGTGVMAANAIASVFNSFSFMPGMAFSMAIITIVGQCIGAGDYEEAKKQTRKIIKYTYITLITIGILIYVFMYPLLGLFSLSPASQKMAIIFLRIHCVTMAFVWPISFALPNALKAAGDARWVMISATASMWIVRVSASYLFTFTFGLGPVGVWIAMAVDFVIRGIANTLRWRGGKWQEKKVISE